VPHRTQNATRKVNHRAAADSLKTELRTSIRRAKAIFLAILLAIALFPSETDSQSRRHNSLDEFDWEESEEDQQCEMVVKCKPTKTASSSSRATSNAPETSTYRVPLKPYGAPFNPMAEGGSVMWQKMGATPKTKSNKKSRASSTTTATNYGEMSNTDNDQTVRSGNSSRRKKKIRKGKYLVSNDVTTGGAGASQSDKEPSYYSGNKPVIAFSVSLRTFFGHPNSAEFKPIPFDVIHSNNGDGYDVDKEAFVAPVEGTYFFTLTITARRGYEAAVDLVHNYRHVWTIVIDSDQDFYSTSWSPGTNSVILHCEKGDRVFARLHGGRFSNLEGSLRNTFTGFLI